jgi:hypothetical protein
LNSPLLVEDPVFGAAGIGILAFRLLDPVPLSAGREFHKIVARFYFNLSGFEENNPFQKQIKPSA